MNPDVKQKNKNDLLADIEVAITLCNSLEHPQKSIYKTILETLKFVIGGEKIELTNLQSEAITKQKHLDSVLKLSEELDISAENIEDIFEFDNETITLNAAFDQESWIQQQFKSTLCLLTAYSICYGKNEISSKDLISQLEGLGIESISNLSPNLQEKQFNKYIKVLGGRGARKKYKIKNFGIKRGKELIKELSSAQQI
jgi:hypothetical protein